MCNSSGCFMACAPQLVFMSTARHSAPVLVPDVYGFLAGHGLVAGHER